MRLTREALQLITGLKRKSAQASWFREYMGVEVPCDHQGPILTEAAYEALLAKRLGISGGGNGPDRPTVRLRAA